MPAAGTDRGGPEGDGGLKEYRLLDSSGCAVPALALGTLLDEASEPATPDSPHGEKGQSQRERRVQGGRL